MRSSASVLHLDLDAFYAAVEQRDKPSLRGKPVVVGGLGARGVVATASYEARRYGVHSAMPAAEARRRCPHAAFLAGRFGVYRQASDQVMTILRTLSPRVEPLSLDEAFVDLAATASPVDTSVPGLRRLVRQLKHDVAAATGGLRASVGVGSSKFIAKVATELGKPDGLVVVEPGAEVDLLRPMPVTVIPGVGPVTADRLRRLGVHTIADLQTTSWSELSSAVGRAQGTALLELAYARDDRPVEPERETKSISVEDTFETDLVDRHRLERVLEADARQVAGRLSAGQLFARTVTVKVRLHDFSTHTRSRTLSAPTDRPELIAELARGLLAGVDTTGGVRLLGVGVAGLTDALQDGLFGEDEVVESRVEQSQPEPVTAAARAERRWVPGADVVHETYGLGWVWGAGLGRVTVRFETRDSPPGPVRTIPADDPRLRPG